MDPSQDSSDVRRPRSRARNWSDTEMLCLAHAKKKELDLDMDNVGQRRFLSSVAKWNEIALVMSEKGYADRTGPICQTKWNNMFGDWKAVRDFVLSSGGSSYYNLSRNERIQAKLVPKFDKTLSDFMESFCLQRPCMVPPSAFDSGRPSPNHGAPSANTSNGTNAPNAADTPNATGTPNASVTPNAATTPNAADAPMVVPLEETIAGENRSSIPIPQGAPGDRVVGSTGRTKRRRVVDISSVLKSSHENLVSSLEKQSTERMLFYDRQLQLQQTKIDLEKVEQESLAADRRAIVSVLKDVANAMNILAGR